MVQRVLKEKMVCTTVLVKVRNISPQLLDIRHERFYIFDSSGNQYKIPLHRPLCTGLRPKKYESLETGGLKLYDGAQATILLTFPQLPSNAKIVRLVCEQWVFEQGATSGVVKDKDFIDIRIDSEHRR